MYNPWLADLVNQFVNHMFPFGGTRVLGFISWWTLTLYAGQGHDFSYEFMNEIVLSKNNLITDWEIIIIINNDNNRSNKNNNNNNNMSLNKK